MGIRSETPCNYGECPYDVEYIYQCEYYCCEEIPDEREYDHDEE